MTSKPWWRNELASVLGLMAAGLLVGGVAGRLLFGTTAEAPPAAPALGARPLPVPPAIVAAPAPAPASVTPPAPRASERARVICIDPGHPSDQSDGTQARSGLTETRVNWQVALRLRDELRRRGFTVVLTKSAEQERVANRRRAELANEAGASLLVRLHCDAASGSGYTVYYPAQPGTRDGQSGPPPEVCRQSATAAAALDAGLRGRLGQLLPSGGVKTDRDTDIGRRQGALTGSIFARVPVVTVELVVLTNDADARWVSAGDHQMLLALGLADGVVRFLQ